MAVDSKALMKRSTSISKITQGNTSGGNAKKSITVVYNVNGKRITISKALAEALKLEATAQLSFVIDDGVILLGKVTSQNEDERIELVMK